MVFVKNDSISMRLREYQYFPIDEYPIVLHYYKKVS